VSLNHPNNPSKVGKLVLPRCMGFHQFGLHQKVATIKPKAIKDIKRAIIFFPAILILLCSISF